MRAPRVLVLLGLLCFLLQESECNIYQYQGRRSLLTFVDEKLNFDGAQVRCQSLNGTQLVEIQDEAEWDEVNLYSFQKDRI